MTKKALILGINGMDGSYLADILLEKGYTVHGLVRRNSQPNLWRIQHCIDQLTIHQGDVTDSLCLHDVVNKVLPDEIYNEADQDHVGFSFAAPKLSVDVTYGAVASLLEIIKGSKIKFFQPLSATMFGDAPAPQNEETPFNPRSPYACAKTAAYYLCKHYREKHGVFVSTAILYNHDSVRRQGDYLLHKICKAAVKISRGDQETLSLTCSSMKVSIGCAREYMSAVYKLMQLENPTDLLIGSSFAGSIYSFVQAAFDIEGVSTERFKDIQGYDSCSLLSDCSKARELIGFIPERSVYTLIRELCEHYTDTLYEGK